MTFRDLGLIAPILSALDDQGYDHPSPIQEKAIPPALEGRDVLGCAQTGTGKTCAFSAPILQRLNSAHHVDHAIRALILTPTRELAIQIGENLEQYGKNLPLRSTVIFGGVGQGPQVDRLKRGVDILVATPGRLGDLYQQKLLDLSSIEIFVLDEADRMLDMGFIHDVKKILKWLPREKQTMLFSATMPKEITKLVDSLLQNPARVAVDPVSSPVEAIEQSVYFVDRNNKTKLLAQLIREKGVQNALIFTRTKHGANKVARDLEKLGITAAAIHGNKSQTARQQALSDFKQGAVRCLVATDIAARGLDIEELSHVFNYNLPEVPETYVHRIGRTGRAGRGGEAIAFCDFGEKPLLREIEKLIGRTIPVEEDHPFPMVVLEAPKRDKNGRIINEEDAEARSAARARHQERAAAAKAVQAQREERKPAPAPEQEQSAGRRRRRRGKKPAQPELTVSQEVRQEEPVEPLESIHLSQRPKLTRPGSHLETGSAMPRTEFSRPGGLAGDHIMDATARLLAPRRSVTRSAAPAPAPEQEQRPARRRKRSSAGKTQPAHQEKQLQKAHAEEQARKGSGRKKHGAQQSAPQKNGTNGQKRHSGGGMGRRGMPMEPMKSNQTKDSTEQHSLMKPYYLDI